MMNQTAILAAGLAIVISLSQAVAAPSVEQQLKETAYQAGKNFGWVHAFEMACPTLMVDEKIDKGAQAIGKLSHSDFMRGINDATAEFEKSVRAGDQTKFCLGGITLYGSVGTMVKGYLKARE